MKLPDFKTEEEEQTFWEKHSISNYWEDLKASDDLFKRPKLTPVTIKFDPLVLKKIKMLAKKRGISYNAYITQVPDTKQKRKLYQTVAG
jgi:predicted DNA binding CopG/RHH family protein